MFRPQRNIVCCAGLILIFGMSVTKTAAWSPSRFATPRAETGSPRLERFNGYSAVEIVGGRAGSQYRDGDGCHESLVHQLPGGFGTEWTAIPERLSRRAGARALYAVPLWSMFLCAAALYESWSVPLPVMLVVPLGVDGALLATRMRGLENVFTSGWGC